MKDARVVVTSIGRLRDLCRVADQVSLPVAQGGPERTLELGGASCPRCSMTVSATELKQLAGSDSSEVRDPLLRRLAEGKCIKEICESAEYNVSFLVHSEDHWARLSEVMNTEAEMARLSDAAESKVSRRKYALIMASAAAVGVVSFFGLRHWIFGYRIPLLQKKRVFRLAPLTNNIEE